MVLSKIVVESASVEALFFIEFSVLQQRKFHVYPSHSYICSSRVTKMKQNKLNIILAIGLIVLAAGARILNQEMHLYNLAPVAAIGLFAGAILKDKRIAFMLPLLSLLISDIYIELFPINAQQRGFYGLEQFFVYGGMLLVTILGMTMKKVDAGRVLGYSLTGSVVFFIVSNFGAYVSGMYGFGLESISTTYIMALPFFKNTLLGDLVGNTALFGGYFLLQQAFTSRLQKAKV